MCRDTQQAHRLLSLLSAGVMEGRAFFADPSGDTTDMLSQFTFTRKERTFRHLLICLFNQTQVIRCEQDVRAIPLNKKRMGKMWSACVACEER